jgi:hypothetical protein
MPAKCAARCAVYSTCVNNQLFASLSRFHQMPTAPNKASARVRSIEMYTTFGPIQTQIDRCFIWAFKRSHLMFVKGKINDLYENAHFTSKFFNSIRQKAFDTLYLKNDHEIASEYDYINNKLIFLLRHRINILWTRILSIYLHVLKVFKWLTLVCSQKQISTILCGASFPLILQLRNSRSSSKQGLQA